MNNQCPGQLRLPLWTAMHPCPVCLVDRAALGAFDRSLGAPYSTEDLIAHLGSCGGPFDDAGIYWDEVFSPSEDPFDTDR